MGMWMEHVATTHCLMDRTGNIQTEPEDGRPTGSHIPQLVSAGGLHGLQYPKKGIAGRNGRGERSTLEHSEGRAFPASWRSVQEAVQFVNRGARLGMVCSLCDGRQGARSRENWSRRKGRRRSKADQRRQKAQASAKANRDRSRYLETATSAPRRTRRYWGPSTQGCGDVALKMT